MATTQSELTPTTVQLIKNTPTEQMLVKINNMRWANLTAEQKQEIEYLRSKIGKSFLNLTMTYFGISREQVLELSDQELEAIFLIVCEKARKNVIFRKITIIGWLFGIDMSNTIILTSSVLKLKKMLGDSFNPVNIIRQQK